MEHGNGTPWFEIYKVLASSLSNHYEKFGFESGVALFEKCRSSDEFIKENGWIDRLSNDSDMRSIDPMHVFSSVSGSNLKDGRRLLRIKMWLKLLDFGSELNNVTRINVLGCPAPVAVNLLAPRVMEKQNEIWGVFNESFIYGNKGLKDEWFDMYNGYLDERPW